jgi:radical SAM protein (TIGR01212 family)
MNTVRQRYGKVHGFIAYFQPATNTYAPIDQLEEVYQVALKQENVVGLAIGTRPDCVPNDVLDLIDDIAKDRYVSLEYGMQSIHQKSLDWMNRAHNHASMVDAMTRSRGRHFETCAHIILGIPGESHADMMATANEVARLRPDGVKLHNLYAVHGTPLGEQVLQGKLSMMEKDDYVKTVVDFLERMPAEMIIERVSGEAPSGFLIAPQWCLEKSAIRKWIDAEFERRGSRQGTHFQSSDELSGGQLESTPFDLSSGHRVLDQTPNGVRERLQSSRKLPVLKLS